ncbi:cytosolic protein [Candidatus Woesearchaeota archaeon]|nr:cytosolic protein [Candidatus Woesearchaeota archaeon]
MECQKESNETNCPCLHTECSRHGVCCECLSYHLGSRQLPACCFPDKIAKTDERSIRKFVEINS